MVEVKNQRKITELFKPKLNIGNQSSDSVKNSTNVMKAEGDVTGDMSIVTEARGHVDMTEFSCIEISNSYTSENNPDLGLVENSTFTSKQQLGECNSWTK